MQPKIAIIGGGSYNWAPTLINDILLTPGLSGCHIALEDIAPEPLEVIRKLGEKMVADKKSDCVISSTTDEAEALEGADFVIVTISTGGFAAMEKDLEIPLRYGVNQTVGDTVGPGGLARALRSIPVMVGIAKNMERQCPEAWLINYTNPMAPLCLAVNEVTKIKALGLCHELQGVLHIIRSLLQLSDDVTLEYRVGGVNHFIWFLSLLVDGCDGFDMLRERLRRQPLSFEVEDQEAKEMFAPSLIDRAKLKFELLEEYGYLPAAGDRHIAEFFPRYLADVSRAEQRYGVKPTSIGERRDSWFAAMRSYVHGMLDDQFPLPSKKSKETLSEIMATLAGKSAPRIEILNLPNEGQIANMPEGAVVETLARVTEGRIETLEPIEIPGRIRDIVAPHADNQFLVVRAALSGDRSAALDFLRRDPLSTNCADAEAILEELLAAHAEHLPQF